MTNLTTASQIRKLQEQIKKLEQKETLSVVRKQNKALKQISAIFKASNLTFQQIETCLGKQERGRKAVPDKIKVISRSKLAGRNIPPKYQNPTNASETWAGRGRAPRWAAELKAAGQLDTALIL